MTFLNHEANKQKTKNKSDTKINTKKPTNTQYFSTCIKYVPTSICTACIRNTYTDSDRHIHYKLRYRYQAKVGHLSPILSTKS